MQKILDVNTATFLQLMKKARTIAAVDDNFINLLQSILPFKKIINNTLSGKMNFDDLLQIIKTKIPAKTFNDLESKKYRRGVDDLPADKLHGNCKPELFGKRSTDEIFLKLKTFFDLYGSDILSKDNFYALFSDYLNGEHKKELVKIKNLLDNDLDALHKYLKIYL